MAAMATRPPAVQDALAVVREELKQRGLDAFVIPSGDPHLSEYAADHFCRRVRGNPLCCRTLWSTSQPRVCWWSGLHLWLRWVRWHGRGDDDRGAALDRWQVLPTGYVWPRQLVEAGVAWPLAAEALLSCAWQLSSSWVRTGSSCGTGRREVRRRSSTLSSRTTRPP